MPSPKSYTERGLKPLQVWVHKDTIREWKIAALKRGMTISEMIANAMEVYKENAKWAKK